MTNISNITSYCRLCLLICTKRLTNPYLVDHIGRFDVLGNCIIIDNNCAYFELVLYLCLNYIRSIIYLRVSKCRQRVSPSRSTFACRLSILQPTSPIIQYIIDRVVGEWSSPTTSNAEPLCNIQHRLLRFCKTGRPL